MKIRREMLPILIVCTVIFVFYFLLVNNPYAEEKSSLKAEYVGSETCMECHEDQYKNYKASVHFQTEKDIYKVRGCEACHGSGSIHVEEGSVETIFNYKENVSHAEKTEKCLTCHSSNKDNFLFMGSDHMKGSITCSDCHKPHAAAGKDMLLTKKGYKLCLKCHTEIAPKLLLNERHRITEGMVSCTDCHKNHEASVRSRLGGFKQENCFKCHTDKQGPFIYEHGAIKVEGCTACHDPHGSVNRHMLTQQSTANLCFSCHISVPIWHNRFTPESNCTNCHSTIHGSQVSPYFLK
ncbi:MAG: DmsE family decaheme c-type cytochrome [Candidatus Aminicenantia bacterium]